MNPQPPEIESALVERPHGRRYWQDLYEEFRREDAALAPTAMGIGAGASSGDGGADAAELKAGEFQPGASQWPLDLSRRRFMQLAMASMALAGLSGCIREPDEAVVPFVRNPEHYVPGQPLYYATALPVAGYAMGVYVESHEGRPTKVEGNPQHPASLGATGAVAQAHILGLYDPDRSQAVRHHGRISSWSACHEAIGRQLADLRSRGGRGLRILTETVTSPTLAAQIAALLEQCPEARWHQYDAGHHDSERQGAIMALGHDVGTIYDFTQAQRVLALDSDFMGSGPAAVRYARDFMAGRRVRQGQTSMNRLYAVESMPSPTGGAADHRFVASPQAIEAITARLAHRLGASVPGTDSAAAAQAGAAGDVPWLDAVARDLQQHAGRSVVIAGDAQPPAVHALVHAINVRLGNVGGPVRYIEPVAARSEDHRASMTQLCEAMEAGEVEALWILGGNPVYTAPADCQFEEHLRNVPLTVHHGLYHDETGRRCQWHLPATHALESWTDMRAFDGTISIVQPLIAPLYDGRSAHEAMALLMGSPGLRGYDMLRDAWQQRLGDEDFEQAWRTALHEGIVPGTASPEIGEGQGGAGAEPAERQAETRSTGDAAGTLSVLIRLDPVLYDGRYANNGWLQELPRPITLMTWDNAVYLSPGTAGRYGVGNGDVVTLSTDGRYIEGPVWIVPGHADDCATVHLGYGRSGAGRCADGAGFNAYPLMTLADPWLVRGVALKRTGRTMELAVTQTHHRMEGRDLVRAGTLAEFEADPSLAPAPAHGHHEPIHLSLYEDAKLPTSEANAWGMVIDTSACIGCNGCMTACQAENNVPVVGKEQVLLGREMHWLRVDRYFEGPAADPVAIHHQPIPCMHCETAPCEVVCPVHATVHSVEGLNEMVYNRCIGTRYCSNNCPYKVRRFNFLEYHDRETEVLKLGRNPDVTVRSRGVMEKCTYCVQRLSAARIEAKKNPVPGKPAGFVPGDEVMTACQQACPTQAITFGNLLDQESTVTKWRAEPHSYALLEELNTRPRTTYLARVTNPNPELQG